MLWGEGWRHPQVPVGDAGVEVGVWLPGIIDAVACKSHTASSVTVGTSPACAQCPITNAVAGGGGW